MSKKFRPMLDVLEAKIALSSSPIPAPVGITTPIEPAPSPADLDTAKALVPPIMTTPWLPTVPFPNVSAPGSPVILGSYGGPAPTTLPNVLAAVPYHPVYPA
jgi:hypothetical protein